ncbi:MAG: hypothetical protein U0930_04790 [Pirellulales bacterium]
MRIMQCPFCSVNLNVESVPTGKAVRCLKCKNSFHVPPPAPQPASTPNPTASTPTTPPADFGLKKLVQDKLLFVVICAIVFSITTIPFSVVISQYYPLTGGFFSTIAEPWSPARRSGIFTHVLIFLIPGLAVGTAVGVLFQRSIIAALVLLGGVFVAMFLAVSLAFLLGR